MQLRNIMTHDVHAIPPQMSLREAAREMKACDVGALPVCQNDKLVGMITDRDITVRSTAEGLDPWTAQVREAMTAEVICCSEDDDVADAARLMTEKHVRRLPVLDRNRRLVGIVSLCD